MQVEVTVWPKDGEPESCRDLTPDDFELTVGGRLRNIEAVDWIGSAESIATLEDVPVVDPDHPPLSLVLFFDLWHLDLFYLQFLCPRTKSLAFEEARRFVREEFRPGDRLLLTTFAGWPQVHGGWIRDRDEALRALDRLEVNPVGAGVARRPCPGTGSHRVARR